MARATPATRPAGLNRPEVLPPLMHMAAAAAPPLQAATIRQGQRAARHGAYLALAVLLAGCPGWQPRGTYVARGGGGGRCASARDGAGLWCMTDRKRRCIAAQAAAAAPSAGGASQMRPSLPALPEARARQAAVPVQHSTLCSADKLTPCTARGARSVPLTCCAHAGSLTHKHRACHACRIAVRAGAPLRNLLPLKCDRKIWRGRGALGVAVPAGARRRRCDGA